MNKAVIIAILTAAVVVCSAALSSCSYIAGYFPGADPVLTANTELTLEDWHISGLMVINSPVAWVRVYNHNDVPIKDIHFQYDTYDMHGNHLDRGTYTLEETVEPHTQKSFVELYLGLVSVYSEHLSLKLLSVKPE